MFTYIDLIYTHVTYINVLEELDAAHTSHQEALKMLEVSTPNTLHLKYMDVNLTYTYITYMGI